ncbi:hypothetical protein BJ742DRAFT_785263 [Cladochytrium replicatum]|nr:hypothetical protein BJ742DRAFT_785263 [Cladochytrium replicatum]
MKNRGNCPHELVSESRRESKMRTEHGSRWNATKVFGVGVFTIFTFAWWYGVLENISVSVAIFEGTFELEAPPTSNFFASAFLRPPCNITEIVSFTSGSSKMRVEEVRWRSGAGTGLGRLAKDERYNSILLNYTLEVYTFKNLCVQGSPEGFSSAQKYWLLGSEDVENVASKSLRTSNFFRKGFHHSPTNPPHEDAVLGIKNLKTYRGHIKWYNGTTYLWTKDERGNHPAALMRTWGNYLSLATDAPEILQRAGVTFETFFDRHQMLEEDYDPNGWATFFMKSMQLAARWILADANLNAVSGVPSLSDWPFSANQGAWWHNAMDFAGPGTDGLHCFETAIKIRHKPFSCFKDPIDAEYARAVGLALLKEPRPKRSPCRPQDLRVVFLCRERPVYNLDRLINIVKAAGVKVELREITPDVPYEEQVTMFHMAHIMISVHGSHLSNQLYMEPTSTLIEMFPRGYYHPEQQHFAGNTGVHHIEIVDNPYPNDEDVLRVTPDRLDHFHHCRSLGLDLGNFTSCFEDWKCRFCHRALGVKVNETVFEEVFARALSAFTTAEHCRYSH